MSLKDDDDDDDETKKKNIVRKKRRVRKTKKSTHSRRTFAPRFANMTKNNNGTTSEPLSTFKSYKHSSQFQNASSVPMSTSSRQMKSFTSNTVVGPGTYNPRKQRRFVSHSFPSEPRFSSSELKSSHGASYYSIDITRPLAPRCRFSLASRSPRKRVDESGTGNTYSSFRGNGPSYRFGPTSSYCHDQSKKIPFFEECSPVFGYGCSVEEHIRYGQCLDGLCGKRAPWEGNIPGRIVVAPINRKPNPLLPGLLFAAKRGDMSAAVKWLSSSTRPVLLQQDDQGRNVLHVCASRHQVSMAELLLARAFELNVHVELTNMKNLRGRTPLHVAADLYNESMVKILLKYGASSEICDDKDQTAVDIVMTKSHAKAHHCFRAIVDARGDRCEAGR